VTYGDGGDGLVNNNNALTMLWRAREKHIASLPHNNNEVNNKFWLFFI
jgi:acyl-CoA thioesterase FadM